jgi:chaperonin cofactor prefoldin
LEVQVGDPVTIRDEDVGRIGDYLKPWLRELVDRMISRVELSGIGTQLMERMVRVEEELKAQRELMDERFGFMERRFEAVDKRFEAVDKRFEAADRRFEDLIGNMNARFEAVDQRFEAVDKRFEDLTGQMNHRFTTLTWMIGVGFVVITSLTTVFALLAG